jgi:hypothetical protein
VELVSRSDLHRLERLDGIDAEVIPAREAMMTPV